MDLDTINTLSPEKIAEEIYKKNVELLQARRRTEQLLYWVSEIIFSVDDNLNIKLFNHTAEKILNKSSEEVLGKPADEIFKLSDEKEIPVKAADYCFQGDPNKSFLQGLALKTAEKTYYVNLKTSVLQFENNKECLVTLVDVTNEMLLDKSKDEFISITSHELRTPLTIIKGYLWMLNQKKNGELTDKQMNYLDKAMHGAERMLNLVNDTLSLSRIEQGKMLFKLEDVDIKKLVAEISEEFKIKLDEKDLKLSQDIPDSLSQVYADKDKLREILVNFIANSVKYTTSGNITVRAEESQEKMVKISIVDTGKGISKEDIKRLFSKFGRLDNSYQTVAEAGGTGLGLYITKSLVEKMGGKVGVDSEGIGKGSTFWFTIPAANPNAQICTIIQH